MSNELASDTRTDLEFVTELIDFLQGTVPEGYKIPADKVPRLTAEQAYTVYWYLSNQYRKVPDNIRQCDACGELFDENSEGTKSETPPYDLCDDCDNERP